MTARLAQRIANFFLKNGVIPNDKIEEYSYGFEIMLADICIIVVIGILSILLGNCFETIVFMISFITLRRTAGGYHAATHFNCNAIFIATYLFFVMLITFVPESYRAAIIVLGIIISIAIVYKLAPISHSNSPASEKKYKRCRKNSLICIGVGTVITTVLFWINTTLSVSYMAGMISVSIYLLAQFIKTKNINRREGK